MTYKKTDLIIGIDASNLRRGGGVTHLVELLEAAEPEKYGISKVVVFCSTQLFNVLPEKTWLHKVTPTDLDCGLIKRIYWQRFKLAFAARSFSCDIIFAPGGAYASGVKPFVTMSRNMLPFEWRELRRYGLSFLAFKLLTLRFVQSRTFKKADGIIFLTEYARKGVLKITGDLSAKIVTIPHGLNSRFLMKPKIQRPISTYNSEDMYRLLYVSIIDQYKHQWRVVEAVASLRMEGIPISLELVGPSYGPALSKLKAAIDKFDGDGRWVNYHGSIPFQDLHRHYARADLGLFASTCENMPNILLETMASGLPIACSIRGPMPEILGAAGVYFDPEKPSDIAKAVRSLIYSTKARRGLAHESYNRAAQFSWKICADKTFAFLAAMAENPQN